MAKRKFFENDRVQGIEDAPASFRGRSGTVEQYVGTGGYGVRFDDRPDVIEFVNSGWIARVSAP